MCTGTYSLAIKVRRAGDKKWYLYVSTAKLDVLYGQVAVPRSEKKTFEWSLTVGLAKLSRKVEAAEEPGEQDKLNLVRKELEAEGLVGTVDEPSEYIRGILPMRWGLLADVGRPEEEPPLVLFTSNAGDRVIGLGGSARHVKYNYGASSTGSRSATPYLVGHLLEGLGLPKDGWNGFRSSEDPEFHTFVAVLLAHEHLLKKKSAVQNVEFFAKVLTTGIQPNPYEGDRPTEFILGTPLYAALAAPLPDELVDY